MKKSTDIVKHRIYTTSFASVYPHYVAKAEKKGRTKKEVDEIILWLTGYTQKALEGQIKKKVDYIKPNFNEIFKNVKKEVADQLSGKIV